MSNAGNAGYATLQVIPSFRGVTATMNRELAGIMPGVGQQAGAGMAGGFSSGFGRALKVAGPLAAVAIAFGKTLNVSSAFEARLSAVAAVSGATGGQLDQLRNKALQLGASTAFSASESARAMEELVKAGIDTQGVLGGAADATVALAAAGGTDLTTAAEIAANAMNSFSLSAADMPKIADLVAGAANASAIGVEDFAYSLQMSGAVANLVGLDFEDLAVGITALGNAGIKGSDAGTSLKTMLMRLEPQTDRAASAMSELGIITADGRNQFFDASGEVKSLAEISGVLTDALAGQTRQQQLATLNTLFGADAIRAAAVLANEGADGINRLSRELGEVSAAEVARQRLDNLNGSLEQFRGSVETLAIKAGTLAIPAVRGLVDAGTDAVNFLSSPPTGFFDPLISAGRDLVDTGENVVELFGDLVSAGRPFAELGAKLGAGAAVAGLTVMADLLERTTGFLADHADVVVAATGAYVGFKGAMIAGAAWTTVSTAVSGATASVTYLTGAIQALAATRGVTTLTASVGVLRASFQAATAGAAGLALGVGAIAGAAAYGYMQWKKWGDEGRKMAEESGISKLRENLDGTADSYFDAARRASQGAALLRQDMLGSSAPWDADFRRQLSEGATAYQEFAAESIASGARIEVGMAGLRAATGLTEEGLSHWANQLGVELAPGLADGSLNVSEFAGQVNAAQEAARGATPVTESLAGAFAVMGDETATAKDRLDAWKTLVDSIFGIEQSVFDATTRWGDAVQELTTSFIENGGGISELTEKGRENRAALSDAAGAAIDLAEAYMQAGRTDEAAWMLANTRDQLLKAGEAAGVSREEMDKYLETLGLTPRQIETLITATTDPAALAEAEGRITQLVRPRTVAINLVAIDPSNPAHREALGQLGNKQKGARWGAIHSYASGGIHAHVAKGDLIRYAEPSTGGEAFIPRLGDRARSTAILRQAAAWYGLDLVPDRRRGIVPMEVGGITTTAAAGGAAGGVQFTGDIVLPKGSTGPHQALDLIRGMKTAMWLEPNGVPA